jgi:hypothetical protein
MFKGVRRCTHAGRRQRESDQEVQLNLLLVVVKLAIVPATLPGGGVSNSRSGGIVLCWLPDQEREDEIVRHAKFLRSSGE